MGEEGGEVVDEDEEEDGSDDGALRHAMSEWEDGGAASHGLPPSRQIRSEPAR